MDPVLGLMWFVVWIVALTCHEAGHAFAAWKLGDPTAYHGGQVTLDPVPHIKREPFGTVILPIISFAVFGWMIGWASAPYDPLWAQQHRRKAAWMALAGPIANLALVIIAALAIRGGMALGIFRAPERVNFTQVTEALSSGPANALATMLSIWFSLNLILFVFNLLPLPPLDGSQVLVLFLDESSAERYSRIIHQPHLKIIGLIIAWNIVGLVLSPIWLRVVNLLYPGANYG